MTTHIKVLGWLYILSGVFGLLIALCVFVSVLGGGLISQDETAIAVTGIVAVVVSGFLVVLSLPGIVAGVGLLAYKNWARILGIVLGVLNLPGFPTGTILGVYSLYVLLDDETSALFMG